MANWALLAKNGEDVANYPSCAATRHRHASNGDFTRTSVCARSNAPVVGTVGAYALCIGFTYPALAFNLEARGISSSVIGLQTSIFGLGLIIGSVFSPKIAMMFGAWCSTVIALIITAVVLLTFGIIKSVPVDWCNCVAIYGFRQLGSSAVADCLGGLVIRDIKRKWLILIA